MSSRLPTSGLNSITSYQSGYLFSPPNSPGVGISPDQGGNNNNNNNGMGSIKARTESFDLQNMEPKDKLEKLKDITSKTIDTIIFKINDMKREKQFLQSFKDIMKISESLVEIERSLDSIQIDQPIPNTSASSSTSTNNINNNESNTSELIKIIHSKSNITKKGSKIQERSTNSIDSIYSIIHKCLDNIKNKLIVIKKQLVFEESVAEALKFGSIIRNIRNQINIFRTITLPENLSLADSEKILLKVENCNYHIFESSIQDQSGSNSSSSSGSSNGNNNTNNGHTNNTIGHGNGNHNNNSNINITNDHENEGIINGVLFLTNYQIIFIGNNQKNENFIKYFSLHLISKINKYGKKKSIGDYSYKLNFSSKDYRNHLISFDKSTNSLKDVRKCVEYYFSQSITQFCFNYRLEYSKIENVNLGWNLYNVREELARMGVPSQEWRVSDSNSNYFLCDSYPSLLVIPDSFSDEHLKQVSQFRSKGRIPSLTYRHWSNKCSITRCSQPRVGIGRNRCEEDELLLNAIRLTSSGSNSTTSSVNVSQSGGPNQKSDKVLYIMDARPYANAVGNRAKGAGWEIMANYPGCVIEFLGIANIHSMRHSLIKFKEACSSNKPEDEDHWFSSIESSGWMGYIKLLLQGASRIVKIIHHMHSNVLVHCSDGWDRTSQLVALAEILLDPFYRTIRGLQILIEKDWLSYGHKFAQRHGQVHNKDEDERAPIFYQFFEALYQLLHQFPSKFEYNSHFLRVILYHSYSGKYGNFLFNTEKDRIQNHVQGKTISLWVEMDENLKDYLNPLYIQNSGKEREVLFPDCSIKNMKIWKQLHFNQIPDSEFYDVTEKLLRQISDRVLDERSDHLKISIPLKSNRARTTSMSLSTSGGGARRLNSSSQLSVPTYLQNLSINGGGGSSSSNNHSIPMDVLNLDNNIIFDNSNSNSSNNNGGTSPRNSKDKDKSIKDGKASIGRTSFFKRKESTKNLNK